jgi:hypothetical protein
MNFPKINAATAAPAAALFLAAVLPSLLYSLGLASSMASGIMAVSILCGLIAAALRAHPHPSAGIGSAGLCALAILSAAAVSGSISVIMQDQANVARLWQSGILLAIALAGGLSLVRLIKAAGEQGAAGAALFVLHVLLIGGALALLGISPFARNAPKPVFFFQEPSHFALSFLPFLLYGVVTSSVPRKLAYLGASLVLALLLKNLTLVVGIAFVALIAVSWKRVLLVLPVLALVLAVVDVSYYRDRIQLSASNTNMSALVYMQGWERASLNTEETYGLGVGFQQFGVVGLHGEISDTIYRLAGEELNVLDGGSVGAKFIGEFGIPGVIALFIYFLYLLKRVVWLHLVSLKNAASEDRRKVFFACCFVMFAIDLFVRGLGYFSSSGFLFLAALLWFAADARWLARWRERASSTQAGAQASGVRS